MQPKTTVHGINRDVDAAIGDLELVAAARAGSNAAFEEVRARYSRRLYRRIRSITRNHEDAEDALQETFLRAYLALDSFEGKSQFASWLTRIAINSALMVLRRRRARPEVSFAPPSESGGPTLADCVPHSALNPEQLFSLRQRSNCVLLAISKLNINLRTVMTTRIEEECSMKELANTLGLSLAAVKARVHRARKQLMRSVFSERTPNSSSTFGIRCQYVPHNVENRELPCPSFD